MPIDCKTHNFKHPRRNTARVHQGRARVEPRPERAVIRTDRVPHRQSQDRSGLLRRLRDDVDPLRPARSFAAAALREPLRGRVDGHGVQLPNKELVPIDLLNLLKYFKGGTGGNKDLYFVDFIASRTSARS